MPQGKPRRTVKKYGPLPVDVHVGSRIRVRRTLMGMSQEKLANAVGLTFQQIQKYERGSNRVSASRLWDFSNVLDVPISFFFDDMPDDEKQSAIEADKVLVKRETLEFVRAYYRIKDAQSRKQLFDLIRAVASE